MSSGHGDKLSHKQEAAIAALMTSDTVTNAARVIGVNENTLSKWLQIPSFQRAYRSARQVVVEHAIQQVVPHVSTAILTLVTIMQDPDVNPIARINAAKAVLDLALKAVVEQDIEQRLADVEALVQEPPHELAHVA
jgi:transposase-like protein